MKQRSTVTVIYQHPAGKPPIFRSDLDACVWAVTVGAFPTIPAAQAAYAALRQRYPNYARVHWLGHVGDILTQQRKEASTAQEAQGRAKRVSRSNITKARQNA